MRKIRHYGLSARTPEVYSCKLIEVYHWLAWRSGLVAHLEQSKDQWRKFFQIVIAFRASDSARTAPGLNGQGVCPRPFRSPSQDWLLRAFGSGAVRTQKRLRRSEAS